MNGLHERRGAELDRGLDVLLTKAVAAIRQYVHRTRPPVRALGKVEVAIPHGGFHRIEVSRLLLTYGRTEQARTAAMAMFVSLEPDTED